MIDLHLHSHYSDGDFSPSEVVKKAHSLGISVLALTDHDSIRGIDEARLACNELSMKFISGVELEASTDVSRSKYIHILNYNFKDATLLKNYLSNLRQERINTINQYIEIMKKLGIDVSFEKINSLTPGCHLTVYHIPMYLCKMGYYSDFSLAKKDFINPNGKYYIKRNYYDVEFVIDLIKKSGGVPILAHPYRLPQKDLELDNYIAYLKTLGLVGIETYYKNHSPKEVCFYEALAKKYNLLQTSGSDWHCDSDIEMGLNPPNEEKLVYDLLHYA